MRFFSFESGHMISTTLFLPEYFQVLVYLYSYFNKRELPVPDSIIS